MFTEDDIDRIGAGLADRTLPKPEWTHHAHFAAAVWLIGHGRAAETPALIRAYNEATGVANTDEGGYHETITQASLRAAAHHLATHDGPRAQALADLLAGPYGRSDWLLKHWSKPRLFSVEARRTWVQPDLLALPFQLVIPRPA